MRAGTWCMFFRCTGLSLAVPGVYCCASFSLAARAGAAVWLPGTWASHCSRFSRCRGRAREQVGYSTFSSRALEHRLSSCGAGLGCPVAPGRPGPGIAPVSPALAGEFFTMEPPVKPGALCFYLSSAVFLTVTL